MKKHTTYQSSMESGCSFIELVDMHLATETIDAVRRYGEKYPYQRVKNRSTFC
jgi:hypothetical protein